MSVKEKGKLRVLKVKGEGELWKAVYVILSARGQKLDGRKWGGKKLEKNKKEMGKT